MLCEFGQAYDWKSYFDVLILVLMEYALRGIVKFPNQEVCVGLNPCFNGICSARQQGRTQRCC